MAIKSINPVNGRVVKRYKEDTPKQVIQKLENASVAWEAWRGTSFVKRAKLMQRVAGLLQKQKQPLAELMALEMGKPIKDGLAEIEKCAFVCKYYARNAAKFLQDEIVRTEAKKSYITYQPLGVVLAVMPWNFPFWQCFRFAAPNLMAGNGALLKHASNVPGCAVAIERILLEAGFLPGVFQTLLISSKEVDNIIENPVVKAVTLTGSTQAGVKIAQKSGECLKKTVLELGGSDAYIVLADADIARAAALCATSRMINNGQSCIAAKRFIVEKKIEKKFVQLLKQNMEGIITGDPLDEKTNAGPMARVDLRDELHQQVLTTISQGATCIMGGKIPSYPGKHAFYSPTILANVKKGMLAYSEEIFGPVATVITASNKAEAIAIANDSMFGLGAAVFTKNIKEGERIAKSALQAGSCFVNSYVKSDARLPFGGVKQSGYGRELGMVGIREFVNIKTVVL